MKRWLLNGVYALLMLVFAGILSLYIIRSASAGQKPALGAHLEPLGLLLLQVVTIISLSRVLAFLARRAGQPSVIGEILAGILLGPAVFGNLLPVAQHWLFPASSLPLLKSLADLGLILFMFVIGMEIDFNTIRNRAQTALWVSHTSIVIPFLGGLWLGTYAVRDFTPTGVQPEIFSLFLGVAMSITAFPVLARIVQEHRLQNEPVGGIALSAAAFDDVSAWILLALVVTVAQAGSLSGLLFPLAGSAIYLLVMMFLIRPLLERGAAIYQNRESLTKTAASVFFIYLFLSALCTELIGIHALFGAFFAGTLMPRSHQLRNLIADKIHDFALLVLVPLFFAYSGLRTDLFVAFEAGNPEVLMLILLVAIGGKFTGAALPALAAGESVKTSLQLAGLMNTRGLMELVVLNIGLDLGILPPSVFSMMVVMALVTTLMTGPWLSLLKKIYGDTRPESGTVLSFARIETGISLLKLAAGLFRLTRRPGQVNILHFTPDIPGLDSDRTEYQKRNFDPILRHTEILRLHAEIVYRNTENVPQRITDSTNEDGLLLLGPGKSIFGTGVYSGRNRFILQNARGLIIVLCGDLDSVPPSFTLWLSADEQVPEWLTKAGKKLKLVHPDSATRLPGPESLLLVSEKIYATLTELQKPSSYPMGVVIDRTTNQKN